MSGPSLLIESTDSMFILMAVDLASYNVLNISNTNIGFPFTATPCIIIRLHLCVRAVQ